VFQLPPVPGTYVLWLRSRRSGQTVIGRLGPLVLQPGIYLYVGSAQGPGGLRARVDRHARAAKRRHWHVDYLRAHTRLEAVYYSEEAVEHEWAREIARAPGAEIPLARFGASDCGCPAHMFYFAKSEDAERSLRGRA
jgi:Uri superfamily endonuclease